MGKIVRQGISGFVLRVPVSLSIILLMWRKIVRGLNKLGKSRIIVFKIRFSQSHLLRILYIRSSRLSIIINILMILIKIILSKTIDLNI